MEHVSGREYLFVCDLIFSVVPMFQESAVVWPEQAGKEIISFINAD